MSKRKHMFSNNDFWNSKDSSSVKSTDKLVRQTFDHRSAMALSSLLSNNSSNCQPKTSSISSCCMQTGILHSTVGSFAANSCNLARSSIMTASSPFRTHTLYILVMLMIKPRCFTVRCNSFLSDSSKRIASSPSNLATMLLDKFVRFL